MRLLPFRLRWLQTLETRKLAWINIYSFQSKSCHLLNLKSLSHTLELQHFCSWRILQLNHLICPFIIVCSYNTDSMWFIPIIFWKIFILAFLPSSKRADLPRTQSKILHRWNGKCTGISALSQHCLQVCREFTWHMLSVKFKCPKGWKMT